MRPTRTIEEMSENVAARIAHILGASSAAARALADLKQRRASGEKVRLYRDVNENVILVGPDHQEIEG